METVYWSHFAEKRGGSLQNAPPPQPHPWNGKGDFESIWGLGVSCHMFHQVVVVWMLWVVCCGGCWIVLRSACSRVIFHSTNMLCDQHQACEGQHGGLLGRRGNWNVLKCFRANHCKHKYALTKWYIYWNDGFSTEWLADFSLSMTNSHFLKAPNHTLKNIYKMAFCLLQNGLSWCP